jgi:hypothetical protein
MTEKLNVIKLKLQKTWLRLLKAEAKRSIRKAAKLESKIIELELRLKGEI